MAEIRLDAPTKFKVIRTDDGRLHCEGAFCRDGVLEYRQPDGSIIRELRRPETNADIQTTESFKLLPLVVEHPSVGLLDSKSYKDYAVGMTDSSAHYDANEGVIKGLVSFFDAKAIAYIDSKEKEELSAGYTCDIKQQGGIWNGQRYDREQINVRANHLALTGRGRAGEDVRLRLDSEQGIGQIIDGEYNKRMAIIRCDGVEYSDIPEAFASIAGSRFKELEELKPRLDSFRDKLELLNQQLKAVEQERDSNQTRIDSLELVINQADSILAKLGYQRTDSGQYIRTDKSGKKKMPSTPPEEEMMEEMDEEGMDEEMEGEEMMLPTKKKGKKKMDSEELVRQDSVSDLLAAWQEADALLPGFSKSRFDSSFSVSDVKRTLLSEIEPDLDLSIRSDAFVDGVFSQVQRSYKGQPTQEPEPEEAQKEGDSEERGDSAPSYVERLDAALKKSCKDHEKDGLNEWDKRRADAYKKPLTMSKAQAGMSK